MPDTSAFDVLPLALFQFATLVAILAAAEAGYRIGRWRRSRAAAEREESVGPMVASALGLVAFLLAFTYGIAGNRYEEKRKALNDEVNAIGTAHYRADFLPEPHRGDVKKLLMAYVEARLLAVQPGRFNDGVKDSEAIQRKLWATMLSATTGQPPSVYISLFIQTLNELIDLHTVRMIAGMHSRIPDTIWYVLLTTTLIGFAATGYHAGLVGTSRSPLAILIALLFTIVIALIMDLERAGQGTLRVNQAPMVELRESFK